MDSALGAAGSLDSDAVTHQRLCTLLFASDKEAASASGTSATLELQGFLHSQNVQDPKSACHAVRLQELVDERLVANLSISKGRLTAACAAAFHLAHLPPDFRFPTSQGAHGLDLLASLSRRAGPIQHLMQVSADAHSKAAQVHQLIKQRYQTQQPPQPPSQWQQQQQHAPPTAATADAARRGIEQHKAAHRPNGSIGQFLGPAAPKAQPLQLPRPSEALHGKPAADPRQPLQPLWTNTTNQKDTANGHAHATNNGNTSGQNGAPASLWRSASHLKRPGGAIDDPAANNHGGGTEGGGGGGGGGGGFQTARDKLIADARKNGQPVPAFPNSQNAPRTGLSRPQKRQQFGQQGGRGGGGGGGDGGAGGVSRGFVPPFVQKALDGAPNGGGRGGGGGAGGGVGGDQEGGDEGPLSARTMQMLAGPDGELPPQLQKLDPKLIEQVCSEILDQNSTVAWDDIAGQEAAKHLVQELVVWPMLNPGLFKGARAPPKGLLLFGPPGTGKTLIGRAIASNIKATFFSISASSLNSKWIGEGEKMVRVLFAVAGCLQPSVIFIDEIDSTLSARKSEGEHESSRRLKTEMLIQMEGCDPQSSDRCVLLIGATNRPEELDEAARRRLPKQLYIPLPCEAARRQMVERQLGPGAAVRAALSASDMDKIVARTAGYSGSDMRNLVQEACQGPVRDAVKSHGAGVAVLSEADLRPVVLRDFQAASKAQKATVTSEQLLRYEQYNVLHGARYTDADTAPADIEEEW